MAEASLVPVREKAALTEAAKRAESQKAHAERKATAAEHARRAEEAARAKAAEEEAKRKAKLEAAADAKSAAKQEKKERRKAPSAFKLQQEQEERAREEQRAEHQRAMELSAAHALKERQQSALQAATAPVPVAIGASGRGRSGRARGRGRGCQRVQSAIATSGDAAGAAAHLLSQASLQVPAGSSNAGVAAPVAAVASALDRPPPLPATVTSLADAQFDTGRPEVPPESTIGGQTTCIICFVSPKSHAAVPCGHRSACGDCSAKMTACPVCRGPVQMWMHVRDA